MPPVRELPKHEEKLWISTAFCALSMEEINRVIYAEKTGICFHQVFIRRCNIFLSLSYFGF